MLCSCEGSPSPKPSGWELGRGRPEGKERRGSPQREIEVFTPPPLSTPAEQVLGGGARKAIRKPASHRQRHTESERWRDDIDPRAASGDSGELGSGEWLRRFQPPGPFPSLPESLFYGKTPS